MSILLLEDTCDTYALVHHFTLYDTEARGFVRPFCMAYVTNDKDKLCDHYESMSKEFSIVSEIFHMYNMQVFMSDLDNRIGDLMYTKKCFLEYNDGNEMEEDVNNMFKGVPSTLIENLLVESTTVLDVVKMWKCRNYGCSERQGSHGEDNVSINQVGKREPLIVDVRNWRRFDFELRSLEELCHGGGDEGLYTLESIYKHFKRSSLTLHMERIEQKFDEPSQSIVTFGKILSGNLFYNKDILGPCVHGVQSVNGGSSSSLSSQSSGTLESFKSADECCSLPQQTDLDTLSYQNSPGTDSFFMICSKEGKVEEESYRGEEESYRGEANSFFSESRTLKHSNWPMQLPYKTSIMHINDLCWTSPGFDLMMYAAQFPFLLNVIYALLSGSSVVVFASHKRDNKVAPFLKALSLFVPSSNRDHHHVIVDMDRLSQVLTKSKLLGCIRHSKDKKELTTNVEGVVTVDLDKESCNAQTYKNGLLLSSIVSKRKSFKQDKPFLSHIHCVLLEFTMKAFLSVHLTRKAGSSLVNPLRKLTSSDAEIVQGLKKTVIPNT